MIEVSLDPSFKRALKRKRARNAGIDDTLQAKLKIFIDNPFDPSLKTHKLSGKLRDYWSFTVEYDLRVIFYFDGPDRAVFVLIGTHEELYLPLVYVTTFIE